MTLLDSAPLQSQEIDYPSYDSHYYDGLKLYVYSEGNALSFSPYGDRVVRVGFHPGADTAFPVSLSLIRDPEGVSTLREEPDRLIYESGLFKVLIDKNTMGFDAFRGGDTMIWSGYAERSGEGSLISMITRSDLSWYGGGSRAIPMDRSGRTLQILNRPQYGYEWGSDLLNISIPVVVSSDRFGLYYENPVPGELSLGDPEKGIIVYRSEEGPLSCFIFTNEDPVMIMEPYTWLTGRQPLPPIWALGYIQSRFGYENEGEARSVVETMIEEDFPIDAIVFDLQWQGGVPYMGNLSWDLSRFPDPEIMMEDFLDQGVKSICITDPYFTQLSQHYPYMAVKDLFATDGQGDPYVLNEFWAGPAGLIDITDTASLDWFWQHYKFHSDRKVAGWWTDLGEPELVPDDMYFDGGTAQEIRQTYNLRWSAFLFNRYSSSYPSKRLFNLTRSGYAGMQRYGAIPWSGDVRRSFEGLRAQIPIMLGMGLSGSGYMSSDIGGFTGEKYPELYARWQQMGAFTPIMRAHGTGVPTEPIYYPEPYRSIVREFIRLRYRMLPYNYTLLWENYMSGIPPARPLFFYDGSLKQVDDEYFWGSDLLVAPVLEAGVTEREVVFPSGKWIDLFLLAEYEGGTSYMVPVTIDKLPVFARAGSLIPMLPAIANTADYDGSRYHVRYFPDPDSTEGETKIYMDDGISENYSVSDDYSLVSIHALYDPDETIITYERAGAGYAGEAVNKIMELELMRITEEPETVLVDGNDIIHVNHFDEYDLASEAAYFDLSGSRLFIKTNWNSVTQGVVEIRGLNVGTSFTVPENRVEMDIKVRPNPVTHESLISFVVSRPGRHTLTLIDAGGRSLEALVRYYDQPGAYTLTWKSLFKEEPDHGFYILRLTGRSGTCSVKLMI